MTTYSSKLTQRKVWFPRKKHERHDIHFEFREYANSTEALITPPGATGGSSSADLSPRTNSNDLRSGFNPARGFPLATLFLRTVSLLANDLRSGFNLYFLLLTMV